MLPLLFLALKDLLANAIDSSELKLIDWDLGQAYNGRLSTTPAALIRFAPIELVSAAHKVQYVPSLEFVITVVTAAKVDNYKRYTDTVIAHNTLCGYIANALHNRSFLYSDSGEPTLPAAILSKPLCDCIEHTGTTTQHKHSGNIITAQKFSTFAYDYSKTVTFTPYLIGGLTVSTDLTPN